MSKVIGIDLGTGNSAVAIIENGNAKVIPNNEGKMTTPSVVNIKDGNRIVGDSAKRKMVMEGKNTISFVKRYMGANWNDPDVQKMNSMVTYDVVNDNGKPRIAIDGKNFTPEEISSYIVNAVKKCAEEYYGEEVKQCVITCPAWFDDTQRQATKLAGELAGLEVLRVINEPTAAILSANIDVENKDKVVAVFDFGCGTLDVSICELSNVDGELMVEVASSYGDVFLGGQNYDNAIVNWLVEEFKKDNSNVDLSKDPIAYSRLVEAAEKAKVELSTTTSTEINLPYITAIDGVPTHLVKTLSRAQFEQLTRDLTNKCVVCMREAIAQAKKANGSIEDIDSILLVGGSTRIPSVQEALKKEFNKPFDKSANVDEAVALGAVIQANIIVGGEGSKGVVLLDVTPISLGIETEGRVMTKLIEANTTIPCKKSQIFTTAVDNQTSVTIQVLQGERPMSSDNKHIGQFNLEGIAPARRGVPQIEVEFNIDANGILSVRATDKATGKEQKITIENPSLSEDEINRIKEEAERYKEEDAKKEKEIREFNEEEGYVYSVENSLNDENFKDKFTDDEKDEINKLITESKSAITEHDIDKLKTANENLRNKYNPIIEKIYKENAPQGGDNPMGGDNPFDSTNNPFGGNPFAQK